MIGKLLTDPRGFISLRTKYRGAKTQIIIALVVGLAFALQHVGSYFLLDDDIANKVYDVLLIQFSIGVLAPFFLWIAATVLMAVTARLLVGRFRTGDIFRLSGWGLAPLLASGILQTAGRLAVLPSAEQPDLGQFAYISYTWEQYLAYIGSATSEPVFIAATVIGALFVFVTGYIWTLVVEELGEMYDYDVDTGTAVVVVALPTLLCLGWVLSPFVL